MRGVSALEQAKRRLSLHARDRRWLELQRRFPGLGEMRVLDLGGSVLAWESAAVRPRHVTIVNADVRISATSSNWYDVVHGDACGPPESLLRKEFDLVFSNSLLEHVGGNARRRELAAVVDRFAARHWVQTPYRYFPVEPHWLVPGMQFLPLSTRVAIARRWPFGPANRHTDPSRVVAEVASVELVTLTEMRDYFPRSEIWVERVLGAPKSLVAIRQ